MAPVQFAGCEQLLDSGSEFVWLESKGTGPRFESDAAPGVNQVHAVWPTCVGTLGRVAEFVENGGHLDAQFAHACTGDESALFFISRTGKDNFVFDVALHLPDIAGVCFRDVHDQECHTVLVLVVELVEGGNLPPEGRSGIAAEQQHHWLLLVQGRELDRAGLVHGSKCEIGRGVADAQTAGPSVGPESFKGKE
jgi:hypothetical protein